MNTMSFSTMTERRTRSMPKINGIHIIGLDMGYSAPKCVYEQGNFIFPNYCKKITGEIFGELSKTDIIYENLDTGERYAVGEMAMNELGSDSVVSEDELFSRNHYLHPNFKICFQTALGLAMWDYESDGSDIFIQTGLPPAYKDEDEPCLRIIMEQTHNFAITNGNVRKEFHLTIKPDQVDVIFQPMGTFWSLCYNGDGKWSPIASELMKSDLMLFDGGFGTLDQFYVKGKELKTKDTNPTLGMRRVLDETRNLIKKERGVSISIPAMQECLKKGKFSVNDRVTLSVKTYPIDDYLRRANELVCKEAFETVRNYVFNIRYLVMTGGTGAAWCDYFQEHLKGVSTLRVLPGNKVFAGNESPLPIVYSNARGYYMYRYNALLRAKR